jgi:hypothetical protein
MMVATVRSFVAAAWAALLVVSAAACAPVKPPPPGLPLEAGGAYVDLEKETSAGMKLATGSVTMSGASQVTCSFQQAGDVRLQIAMVAECDTNAPLRLLIRADGQNHRQDLKVALKGADQQPEPQTVLTDPFETPAPGTLVRTRVQANCSGVGDRRIWATAHCLVPQRRR